MFYSLINNNIGLIYIFFLLSGITYKYLSRHYYKNAKNDIASTILTEFITALTIFLLIPFFRLDFVMPLKYWILLFISSIFYAFIDLLITINNKHLPVATTNLLWRSNMIYITLIGIFIFHQMPSIKSIFALILVIIAQIILFYKKQTFKISKHEALALLSPLLYSIAIMIDVGISNQINLAFYAGLTLLIPSLILSIIYKIKPKQIVKEFKSNNKLLFLLTTAWAIFIPSNILAYRQGKIINAVIINSLILVGLVLLDFFVDKQKENYKNKFIATILIIVGNIINNV